MLKHDATWLTVRVQNGVVQAQIHASTIDDNGLSASESYGVFLDDQVASALLAAVDANGNEAAQRALEVGFASARSQRLELGGAMGANGGIN